MNQWVEGARIVNKAAFREQSYVPVCVSVGLYVDNGTEGNFRNLEVTCDG